MDRIRRQQTAKQARRRLAELRPSDGLPVAFPLQSIGQWIQVMNLQQETPFPQRLCSQVLTHHYHQHNHHIQGSVQSLTTARDYLRRLHHHPQQQYYQQEIGATSSFEIEEPDSLPTRRDFVTDRTLKTILDHCPNLRRLTISDCRGITDRGMQFLREAPCVARGTLVSLHMAACFQITDQGLLNLVRAHHHHSSQKVDGATTTTTAALGVPRFESLDLAGCFQVSDRGLIPLLEQCGIRLLQLRVSDCEKVSFDSVMALTRHCSSIQWLDLARSGTLTEECLIQLSERCPDLEWLNLARQNPNEPSPGTSSSENQEEQEEEEVEVDSGSADVDEDEDEDEDEVTSETTNGGEDIGEHQDPISDRAIARLCESCPRLQLLDLSYITTITNTAIESLSESATSLVCLTIIGCSGITTLSLTYLAKLRNKSSRLGCITMGDALGISERDIEKIMEGTLSGWQKSFVDETNMGDILGRSWDE
jgi:hypothetical protein